ncbi:MAG: hypothetical protein AB7G47_04630 [Mycolicibacterium sp.]|uniref:hypothetical protein n=1 Tax=Mycolicibacterium sp. TaxID=2320850 RepID=UPI003D1419A3
MAESSTEPPESHPGVNQRQEKLTPEEIRAAEDVGAVDPPEGTPDAEDTPDGKASKEAAKYRHQLRATEAERDDLAARLESVQRSQVESEVSRLGVKPEALWAAGVELGDLLTEDGTVDPNAVADKVAGVREKFGIETSRPYRGIKGMKSGAGINVPTGSSWSGAFAPKDGFQ